MQEQETSSFRTQINAILRKNAVLQRRSLCLNSCIVFTPVVFLLLLFGLQKYIDTLTDVRDNRCGCMCTLCCAKNNSANCRPANQSSQCLPTLEECKSYNDDICGLEYSDPEQAFFCEVSDPFIWPAVVDVPRSRFRPGRWKPDVVFFVAAEDPTVREGLTSRLMPEVELNEEMEVQSVGLGEWISSNGVVFGTSKEPDYVNYIEPAFVYDGLTLLSRNCTTEATQSTLETINIGLAFATQQVRSFVGSGDFDDDIATCANVQILANNSQEIDNYFYCNYEDARCNATAEVFGVPYEYPKNGVSDQYSQAMDFKDTDERKLDADFWIKDWNFDVHEDSDGTPNQRRASQPINMMSNAWIKYSLNDNRFSARLLGIQELPKPSTRLNLQFSSIVGVLLFTWVVQLLMPLMLVQLVYEKEGNLRIMMKMHGLGDAAYWLVNYAYYLLIYLMYILVFVTVGSVFGFVIFTKNDYSVQFAFLLLFGNLQIAFTFFLSNFFKTSRGCIVFSFLWIFGTGMIGVFLLNTLFARNKAHNYFLELVPAFAAYRGLYELGEYGFRASYSNADGLSWAKFDEENNHMGYLLIVLLVEWPIFMIAAWYLEQIMITGPGLSRHPLFFLKALKNLTKSSQNKTTTDQNSSLLNNEVGDGSESVQRVVSMDIEEESPDEANERRRVESLTDSESARHSIIINKLRKVFPPNEGTPEKVAVHGLTMGVQRGEVFGLLGPNGAGKTTTINMLIGFMNASSGTAWIEGYDIKSEMETLYGLMGVCPQHNLLWETLTGFEHLLFYGRLKGLKNERLHQAAEEALKSVNLFHGGVGNQLVKGFSGGMKRRLSVAISLIGDPKVVYLDEPSTGLDPASRRHLWKVVKSAKRGKAIILTTHNMEEAEELCDRLGIFVDGRLHVIGNPKNLTSRYGGYLVFTVITDVGSVSKMIDLVHGAFPNAAQTYSVAGTLKFELPSREISLSNVFHFMEVISQKIKVLDWGVASVTLEEVFIKIAKEAGAKSIELP